MGRGRGREAAGGGGRGLRRLSKAAAAVLGWMDRSTTESKRLTDPRRIAHTRTSTPHTHHHRLLLRRRRRKGP